MESLTYQSDATLSDRLCNGSSPGVVTDGNIAILTFNTVRESTRGFNVNLQIVSNSAVDNTNNQYQYVTRTLEHLPSLSKLSIEQAGEFAPGPHLPGTPHLPKHFLFTVASLAIATTHVHYLQTYPRQNRAVQFLGQFPGHCKVMARLNSELHNVCATLKGESPLLAREKIYELIKAQWGAFLGTHPVDRQRSGHFQNQLTIALENWVVNCLHELLFPLVCEHYQLEDEHILTRAIDLASAGVTADQLGAPQHFAVPLPAAVVELASLDTLTCPVDKLTCLHTVVDLIFAQIKAAIGDAHCTDDTFITEENHFPTMTTDDLIPLLITVIIQAKPIHAASNLFYVENFQWTLSPNDAVSLVTFKAALQELLQLNPDHLRPRNEKVLHELGIDDLIEVSSKVCERLSLYGSTQAWSPLDKHLQRTIAMIEASTLEADLPTHSSTSNIEKPQFRRKRIEKVELEEVNPHFLEGRVENHLGKPLPTVHPTDIQTLISLSSAVKLNMTNALANYATEVGVADGSCTKQCVDDRKDGGLNAGACEGDRLRLRLRLPPPPAWDGAGIRLAIFTFPPPPVLPTLDAEDRLLPVTSLALNNTATNSTASRSLPTPFYLDSRGTVVAASFPTTELRPATAPDHPNRKGWGGIATALLQLAFFSRMRMYRYGIEWSSDKTASYSPPEDTKVQSIKRGWRSLRHIT
uniref:VPS9 domain-containing protein n=1 Tax=Timema cristinae TaxID=61476 RepID=A0A7R9CWB4_TIMCR|nr:unnamed protein product [Timema cristinae]